MKIETWNTGRLYSAAGQRMAATRIGEKVYFVDADRQIDGEFAGSIGTFTAQPKHWTLEQTVMDAYDNGVERLSTNGSFNGIEYRYKGIGYSDEERAIKATLYSAAALDGVIVAPITPAREG